MVRSKTIHVHVAQQVEAAALNPAQCGFDSLRGHQLSELACYADGADQCSLDLDVVCYSF